jgi:hypothetical protein
MKTSIVLGFAALALAACSQEQAADDAAAVNAMGTPSENASEDPFGATGAPGADLTDNGATDASNGFADNAMGNVAE